MAKQKTSRPSFKRKAPRELQNQSKIPPWVWLAIGGAAMALLVVGLFYLGYQGQAIANSGIAGLNILPDTARQHQDGDITYTDDAPAGGVHNTAGQNCGIYDEPVRVENILHSLEHGAAWIAYRPDLPADQIEILQNLVRQERSSRGEPMIILAPKPNLDAPIIATAWRVQLELEDTLDERLAQFVSRYQRGSFTPEPGAVCTGGVGEPLS